MFEDALLKKPRSRAPALVVSYAIQVVLLGLLVLVPLLHTEALPTWWSSPPVVHAPSGGSAPRNVAVQRAPRHHTTLAELMATPITIPVGVRQIREDPLPSEEGGQGPYIPGAIEGNGPPGVPWGPGTSMSWLTATPPPLQPKPANTRPIRVSFGVSAAKLIYHPDPEYPPLARMARIQGTVLLEAIIGKDGTIQNLKVISGHPLLTRAAMEAVERWRYQPTLLNNEPVDVLTEIMVNFKLSE